jgi:hypothetical protein
LPSTGPDAEGRNPALVGEHVAQRASPDRLFRYKAVMFFSDGSAFSGAVRFQQLPVGGVRSATGAAPFCR